jgi:hypothetical protein
MTRTALSLALVALGLAACASPTSSTQEQRIATNVMQLRPGQGEVISAAQARPPITAAAGGTSAPASTAPSATAPAGERLGIRMNDGTVQYVDVNTTDIPVGSRVELSADRTIKKM